ncbi:hypothetical protein LTS18_012778, partial [Coniosporium uncinatum]
MSAPGVSRPSLDLSSLPPVLVLPTHIPEDDVHGLEDRLAELHAPLTYDATEARLVLSNISSKRRAALELRALKLWTEETTVSESRPRRADGGDEPEQRPNKRAKTELTSRGLRRTAAAQESSETESEVEQVDAVSDAASEKPVHKLVQPVAIEPATAPFTISDFCNVVKVVKLDWFEASLDAGRILPLHDFLIYEGRPVEKRAVESSPTSLKSEFREPVAAMAATTKHNLVERPSGLDSILQRAKADAASSSSNQGLSTYGPVRHANRRFGNQTRSDDLSKSQKAHLLQQTTSEYEGIGSDIPEPPEWVKKGVKYACQRSTPPDPPNEVFINQLEKIKLARLLNGDEIG